MNAAALKTEPPLPETRRCHYRGYRFFPARATSKKLCIKPTILSEELGIKAQIVEVPVTTMTKAALAESGLDNKSVLNAVISSLSASFAGFSTVLSKLRSTSAKEVC